MSGDPPMPKEESASFRVSRSCDHLVDLSVCVCVRACTCQWWQQTHLRQRQRMATAPQVRRLFACHAVL
jgi:hypothetical protein